MARIPVRTKAQSAKASRKRKRDDDEESYGSATDDDGSPGDHADEDASHVSDDEEDEALSSSSPRKKRKLAKRAASPRGSKHLQGKRASRAVEESAGDDAPPSKGGIVVKRPSAVYKNKKLAARKGKFKSRDISDTESSTDGSATQRPVNLPPLKGSNYVKAKAKASRRLGRAMDRSVLDRAQEYPSGTADDFKQLIPAPQYDDFWTQADQDELEQQVKGDRDFQKRCGVVGFVASLWKTVYRFTGRLATDIIGPRSGLEFKSDSHLGDGPSWTQKFCEAMTAVVLHPFFNLSTEKMSLALQWAVICRTDDKRKRELSGCGDDLFLRTLVSVITKHQDGTRPAGELRELASYKYMRASGETAEPPLWSLFLGHIEDKVRSNAAARAHKNNKASDAVGEAEAERYFVNVGDVNAVRSALDRMKHLSMRMFVDTRMVTDAVKATRDLYDIPDKAQVRLAIRAVLLQEMRNKLRVERGAPPEAFHDYRPDIEPPSWYEASEESSDGGPADHEDRFSRSTRRGGKARGYRSGDDAFGGSRPATKARSKAKELRWEHLLAEDLASDDPFDNDKGDGPDHHIAPPGPPDLPAPSDDYDDGGSFNVQYDDTFPPPEGGQQSQLRKEKSIPDSQSHDSADPRPPAEGVGSGQSLEVNCVRSADPDEGPVDYTDEDDTGPKGSRGPQDLPPAGSLATGEAPAVQSGDTESSLQRDDTGGGSAAAPPRLSPVPSSPMRLTGLDEGIITLRCSGTKRSFGAPRVNQHAAPSIQAGGSTQGLGRDEALAGLRVPASLGQEYVRPDRARPFSFVND